MTGCLNQAIADLQLQVKSASGERLRNLRKRLGRLQDPKIGREWQKSYASHVKKFPMLVLTNGLGTTLAFLQAKGKNDPSAEEEVLYRHLSRWVTAQIWGGEGNTDLLSQLIAPSAGSDVYRRATVEALAFVNWLKRFAEAKFEAEPDSTAEEEGGEAHEPTTAP